MMALPVSGTNLRRVRDVDMKRDYAFVVCISLPILLSFLFKLYLGEKNAICWHPFSVLTGAC